MDRESTLHIAAELENLAVIRRFVEKSATALGADPAATSDVVLAADEAATNVMVHGYRGQPGTIEIEVSRMGDALVVCLRDRAAPFDPTTVPPPDLNRPLEERSPGGMGIYLMRHLVDEVTYHATPQEGNLLTLVKRGLHETS